MERKTSVKRPCYFLLTFDTRTHHYFCMVIKNIIH